MSDYCIATLIHGTEFKKVGAVTVPQMQAYAKKIGADFQQLVQNPDVPLPEGLCAAWLKLPGMHKALGKWKRVAYFDGDALIDVEKMPNIFEVVPEDAFGAFFEGRIADRGDSMFAAMKEYDIKTPIRFEGQYFNSGVMVCSEIHRDLFIWPEKCVNNFYEQGLLNARLMASNAKIYELPYKFNRMSLVDNLVGEDRRGSYVIHYAGFADKDAIARAMNDDLRAWREKDPVITRIHCAVGGGLGDVVCSEPLLRTMIEDLYAGPENEIIISTSYPRIFSHFNYPNVRVVDSEALVREEWFDKGIAFVRLESHTHRTAFSLTVPYSEIHNQDYNGYCLAKRLLPPERKTIKYDVAHVDRFEMSAKAGNSNFRKCVAVHAGTGWKTKTFPAAWWLATINNLIRRNLTPILIGKHVSDEHSYVRFNAPEGCLDLRDKLSLPEMIAVVEACPALVSNDSAPVHIAGAFDNWIFMIATTKRAELVLPWRHGRTSYKAMGLCKKCVPSCHGVKPNTISAVCTHSDLPFGTTIDDFLPHPQDVVDQVYTHAFGG